MAKNSVETNKRPLAILLSFIEIPSAKTAEIKIEWAGRPVEAGLLQTGKTYKR